MQIADSCAALPPLPGKSPVELSASFFVSPTESTMGIVGAAGTRVLAAALDRAPFRATHPLSLFSESGNVRFLGGNAVLGGIKHYHALLTCWFGNVLEPNCRRYESKRAAPSPLGSKRASGMFADAADDEPSSPPPPPSHSRNLETHCSVPWYRTGAMVPRVLWYRGTTPAMVRCYHVQIPAKGSLVPPSDAYPWYHGTQLVVVWYRKYHGTHGTMLPCPNSRQRVIIPAIGSVLPPSGRNSPHMILLPAIES